MKIAISANTNNGVESQVAQHFGRCPFFILVDTEEEKIVNVTAVENPYFQGHEAGKVPAFINSLEVNVMISGGMGGRAIEFFNQFGIQTCSGASGLVADALNAYFNGQLAGSAPCKHEH